MIDFKYLISLYQKDSDFLIRDIFIKECYNHSKSVDQSWGCDSLEGDILDMLWRGFYFVEIIKNNKEKYFGIQGNIPKLVYKSIMD